MFSWSVDAAARAARGARARRSGARPTSCTSRRPRRCRPRSRCSRPSSARARSATRSPSVIGAFRFTAGFGKTLSKLVRAGIGVHHAGMLPRYRRLVEQLAQTGLLKVICGTDTLGRRHQRPDPHGRLHRAGEVRRHQPPAAEGARVPPDRGPRGPRRVRHHGLRRRAGARAHDRERAPRGQGGRRPEEGQARAEGQAARRRRQLDRGDLRRGCAARRPRRCVSRMRVNHAMLLNVINQRARPRGRAARAAGGQPRGRARPHAAVRAGRVAAGGAAGLRACSSGSSRPTSTAARCSSRPALQQDFALNQPLASFAQAAFDLIDPESETFALDVLSVVESILDDPFPVLMAQAKKARDAAVASMKADGIEYEERMALLEEITYPKPLDEPLAPGAARCTARRTRGCRRPTSPRSRSCATCTSGAGRSPSSSPSTGSTRSEGLVLRYLSDTYRALRQTVPDRVKTDELDDIERVARRDRAPGRLEPARRVGGADRPGVRGPRGGGGRRGRADRPAAPDHRQRARASA